MDRLECFIMLYVWAMQERPPKGRIRRENKGREVPSMLSPPVISSKGAIRFRMTIGIP